MVDWLTYLTIVSYIQGVEIIEDDSSEYKLWWRRQMLWWYNVTDGWISERYHCLMSIVPKYIDFL